MNIIKPQKLEDKIINNLTNGEKVSTTLLETIRKQGKNITKQGFYAALRKLKSEEIILIYKGRVSLNTVWIKKMKDLFGTISRNYTIDQNSFDVLGLQDGENITYMFNSIRHLDIFWGHSQNILLHNTTNIDPIYCYDPHYWFYIARKDTEIELLKEIVENKRQFLMTVGGTMFLDKIVKKEFNNDFLQYNFKKMFEKNNYYVTIIGDYITEVHLDEKISKEIDDLYKEKENIDDKIVHKLKSYLDAKVKNKIKITRNKNKAERLKKMMKKDFYIIKR